MSTSHCLKNFARAFYSLFFAANVVLAVDYS